MMLPCRLRSKVSPKIGRDFSIFAATGLAHLVMPATSVVKRTQRVQEMQRVMWVSTNGPRSRSSVARFGFAESARSRRHRPSPDLANHTRHPDRKSGNPSGWLISRNSITPSRAFLTMGELVLTTGGCPSGPGRKSLTCMRTGCGRLWRATHDFDQTHPTVARYGQAFMVAETWNFHASLLASLNEGQRPIHFNLSTVDVDFAKVAHASIHPE